MYTELRLLRILDDLCHTIRQYKLIKRMTGCSFLCLQTKQLSNYLKSLLTINQKGHYSIVYNYVSKHD